MIRVGHIGWLGRAVPLAIAACFALAPPADARSKNAGTLTGKVTFAGAPPAPQRFAFEQFPNPGFCSRTDSDGQGHRVVQLINVGKDLALRDVVIALRNVPMKGAFEFKGAKVIADGCRWLVQGGPSTLVGVVVNGKDIEITNMDADPEDSKSVTGVLHTARTYEVNGGNSTTVFNRFLADRGQRVKEPVVLRKKGSFLKLEDAHRNFMQAFFLPVENPYYAIVQDDGTFAIRDIPPGIYTALAWHPVLGTQRATVKIPPRGLVRADFSFASLREADGGRGSSAGESRASKQAAGERGPSPAR
jgi:hypothetical protein